MKFKIGAKVVCVDDDRSGAFVTVGKEYEILEERTSGEVRYVVVKNDAGHKVMYFDWRFQAVCDPNAKMIDADNTSEAQEWARKKQINADMCAMLDGMVDGPPLRKAPRGIIAWR